MHSLIFYNLTYKLLFFKQLKHIRSTDYLPKKLTDKHQSETMETSA